MSELPVIFIHKGDHFYLNYSLSQVHVTNPNTPIYLITDSVTHKHRFVNYININDYFSEANVFAGIYQHMSSNGFENELFCFQRWFILNAFCKKNSISQFLYLDSDVLIYCNINKVFSRLKEYDFTISKDLSPHCCYFPTAQKLEAFCAFIPKLYLDEQYKQRFITKHLYHIQNSIAGGVCDMTAFNEYSKESFVKAIDLSQINNNETFDDNINESDGFEMENGHKALKKQKAFYFGRKNGQDVRFNTLHFQASAKKWMCDFYSGSDLKLLSFRVRVDRSISYGSFLFKVFRRLGYKPIV
jgi:hypothetical protein